MFAPAEKEQASADEKGAYSEFGKHSEGCVDVADGACTQDMQLQPERTRGILQQSCFSLSIAVGGVDQQSSDGPAPPAAGSAYPSRLFLIADIGAQPGRATSGPEQVQQ